MPSAKDDPLVARDSAGNLAPIAQFYGEFTPYQAAQNFAGMASPEPRDARFPEGEWSEDGGYSGTFKLVGGKRLYLLTFDTGHRSWRVYLLPRGWKPRKR